MQAYSMNMSSYGNAPRIIGPLRGTHRSPVDYSHKGPVMLRFDCFVAIVGPKNGWKKLLGESVSWNAMTLIWRHRNIINIADQTFYIIILDDYNSIHISKRYEILCYLVAKQLHNSIKCVDTRFITCTATHYTTSGDHVSGEYLPQNMNRLQPRWC